MTPRPRKVTDDEVFAAAHSVMQRLGPQQVTLAAIADEAGVTAGALVQRFGSKRALLLALMERFAGGTRVMLMGVRAAAPSPVAALRGYGECMAAMGTSPAALAHHLAWLQQDLIDPDFNRYARAQAQETTEVLKEWIIEAIDAGELVPESDPAALARAVQVTAGGSLIAWGFYREESAEAWVRHDLDVLLEPWLATRKRGRVSTKPPHRGARPKRAKRS
jgi:AcrR family transcriptional regulator